MAEHLSSNNTGDFKSWFWSFLLKRELIKLVPSVLFHLKFCSSFRISYVHEWLCVKIPLSISSGTRLCQILLFLLNYSWQNSRRKSWYFGWHGSAIAVINQTQISHRRIERSIIGGRWLYSCIQVLHNWFLLKTKKSLLFSRYVNMHIRI